MVVHTYETRNKLLCNRLSPDVAGAVAKNNVVITFLTNGLRCPRHSARKCEKFSVFLARNTSINACMPQEDNICPTLALS